MLSSNAPWIRTSLIFIFLYLTAILYCRAYFYRDPGSRFFDESRAFDRAYSTFRENEINKYIDTFVPGKQVHVKAKKDPRICATFVSVKREGADYLPLALASAVHGLDKVERADLHLNVLIAHVDKDTHPTSQQHWPFEVADTIANYNNLPQDQLDHLKKLEDNKAFSEKAVIDYTHALRKCLDTKAEWVVLFEDDVLLADGWFVRVLQGVLHLDAITSKSKWLFMRLFNQERSIGWSSREIGGNHEFLISCAVALPLLFVLSAARKRSKPVQRNLDHASIFIICLIAIPSFVILFFQAGKASLLPPKPGVRAQPYGCCSQGMVFPRQQVTQVTEYLLNRTSGQIDMMLDDYAVEQGLTRYAHYPVLLQHIGIQSARKTTAKEAQAIWSMAFEQQDPKRLAFEHTLLRQSIYGVSTEKSGENGADKGADKII